MWMVGPHRDHVPGKKQVYLGRGDNASLLEGVIAFIHSSIHHATNIELSPYPLLRLPDPEDRMLTGTKLSPVLMREKWIGCLLHVP